MYIFKIIYFSNQPCTFYNNELPATLLTSVANMDFKLNRNLIIKCNDQNSEFLGTSGSELFSNNAYDSGLFSPPYRSTNTIIQKNHLNWPLRYNPVQVLKGNTSNQNSCLQLNPNNVQKYRTTSEQLQNQTQPYDASTKVLQQNGINTTLNGNLHKIKLLVFCSFFRLRFTSTTF